MTHVPEIRPISDLVRDARGLIELARQKNEPVIITQRGRDVAVLVPIERYREMEKRHTPRIVSPRLVNPTDASKFRMNLTLIEPAEDADRADV
jgi:prevent-host-death family protein